ncbi:hypothetical protein C8Q74DRAFT_1216606 [Fomes fomentarius]|nr:hypothetical protein C8Q74DRAFT_1216606 [Fomes fomentarius]
MLYALTYLVPIARLSACLLGSDFIKALKRSILEPLKQKRIHTSLTSLATTELDNHRSSSPLAYSTGGKDSDEGENALETKTRKLKHRALELREAADIIRNPASIWELDLDL